MTRGLLVSADRENIGNSGTDLPTNSRHRSPTHLSLQNWVFVMLGLTTVLMAAIYMSIAWFHHAGPASILFLREAELA